MIFLDVFYVAISTIGVMALLQLATFVVMKILYPPEPQIIYRNVPVHVEPVQRVPEEMPHQQKVTFTQPAQEIVLPEYEPRKPASTSLRMDTELPPGIQETRPPGT